MSATPDDRGRTADEVATGLGLGARRWSSPLRAGMDLVQGLWGMAMAIGAGALLVDQGTLTSVEGVAGVIVVVLVMLFCAYFGWRGLRSAMAKQGRSLHGYVHGLVVETKTGARPLPHTELLVRRQRSDQIDGASRRSKWVYWQLGRRGETRRDIELTTKAPDRLQALLDAALVSACAAQAESQAADLRAGSTVTFGDVSFDLRRLRAPGYDMAWTEVRAVDLGAGWVTVTLDSGGVAKGRPQLFRGAGTVPNFPLFWDLFQHAFRRSRPNVDRP